MATTRRHTDTPRLESALKSMPVEHPYEHSGWRCKLRACAARTQAHTIWESSKYVDPAHTSLKSYGSTFDTSPSSPQMRPLRDVKSGRWRHGLGHPTSTPARKRGWTSSCDPRGPRRYTRQGRADVSDIASHLTAVDAAGALPGWAQVSDQGFVTM